MQSFSAMRWLLTLVMLGLLPTWLEAEDKDKKSDLPIQRVVMFSSGVAFFEHRGEVSGNAQVDLKFNVRDINDLLKSMVLQDDGGGKISTVSYGSKDPITRTLRTFSIDLTSNPTLADLLGQVRGEEIEIDAPTKIKGTIVGVEMRSVPVKENVVEVAFLNLLTEEGLRSVSLENVGKIRLVNPKLDAEFRQALLVLAAGKAMDKKAVSLNFLGEGKRPVRVGYIQESPIWKTSYRLVLADEKPPFLQGWAIVENTTEADWNQVALTLVSGRPISFAMDLYQPLYITRPVVVPELFASLRPRTYDQDLAARDAEFADAAKGESPDRRSNLARRGAAFGGAGGGGFGGGGMGGGMGGAPAAAEGYVRNAPRNDEAMDLQRSVQTAATAGEVGEMFRYDIATPVTIARSSSAMLPIVNESVKGEKVAIYNESQHAKHPLSGLRLKNSTDLHLMQGPITVFDDGAYAGDAQIQDLPPKSERLVAYALDLNTEVAPSPSQQHSHLVSVRLLKGTAIVTHKNSRSRSYTVKNSGKQAKQVLIEYPLDGTWNLVTPKEPAEKTRSLYRFEVQADPGKPVTFEVEEEHPTSQTIALNSLDDNAMGLYIKAAVVSPAVKEALTEVVKRKALIQQMANQRQELERQVQVVDQEQNRIRGNMAQLGKDSELFRRYEVKFTKQEDEVERLREKITATIAEEQKLRKEFEAFLINLNLN
jgi:hypothetical protein